MTEQTSRRALVIGLAGVVLLAVCLAWLGTHGLGVLGSNNQVPWGLEAVGFVFWLGIAHSGTLLSAGLLLLGLPWRQGISRSADTMTLAALACALVAGAVHSGAAFFGPSSVALWAYALVAVLFWYVGLVPELAAQRDRTGSPLFRFFALGWRGSGRHWAYWKRSCALLAGLAVPTALVGEALVAFDFASARLPGWHGTLAPLGFAASSWLSGLAVFLLVLLLPSRKLGWLRERQLDNLGQLVLAASLLLAYARLVDPLLAWQAGEPRLPPVSTLAACAAPQLLWSRKLRGSSGFTLAVAALVCLATFIDRAVIVVAPQTTSWTSYAPTWVDGGLVLGTAMLFLTGTLLLFRLSAVRPQVKA